MTSKNYLLAIATLFSVLFPSVAIGQVNPRIMLEKSQSYTLDNRVRAFRVPVTNSAGVVTYYDVTVTLGVSQTGVVNPTASVVATKSPEITTGAIVPGKYRAADGSTCVVTNMTLTNGRIQSFLSCLSTLTTKPFELSVATGPVSAGHPYFSELVAAKINTRSDVNASTWGLMTNGVFSVGSCGSGINYGPGWPIGAKSNGNQLILSVYVAASQNGAGTFICSGAFTKQP